jgi:WD40 repeat protein
VVDMSASDVTTAKARVRWWLVAVATVTTMATGCSSSSAAARHVRTFAVPRGATGALAWSPNGRQILTLGAEGAMLWDATSGAPLLDLRGRFSSSALDVAGAFDVDGSRFVTPSDRSGAIVWDTATGRQLATFGSAPVYSARFSPDGTKVLTVGSNGAAMWDTATGRQLTVFGEGSRAQSGTISRDGTKVVTMSSTPTVWDAVSGTEQATLDPGPHKISHGALSPDGRRLVAAGISLTDLILFDVATGAISLDVPGAPALAAGFNPDGTEVVTASGDRSAAVRDASTGAVLARLTFSRGPVDTVAFSPDGTSVAAGNGTSVTIWDVSKVHP